MRLYTGLAHNLQCDPLHPDETLAVSFIIFLEKNFKTQKTVRSLLSTLTSCLKRAGLHVLPFESKACSLIVRSISTNKRTPTLQRPPVGVETLQKVVRFWRANEPHGYVLATAALLMFVTSVRQSNLLPTSQKAFDRSRQIVWDDILWRPSYLKINIKWGKAQQKITTRFQRIPKASSYMLCTYTALKALRLSRPRSPRAPVISFPDGAPIPVSYMNKKWKYAMKYLGLSGVGFTLHSLRRGGARYLQDNGASPGHVAIHGGWKSKAVLDYIKPPSQGPTYRALKSLS